MTLFRDHHDDYDDFHKEIDQFCDGLRKLNHYANTGKRYCYPHRYDILVPTRKGWAYIGGLSMLLFIIGYLGVRL